MAPNLAASQHVMIRDMIAHGAFSYPKIARAAGAAPPHLLEMPDQYLDEMALFLWDEFEVRVTNSTISRTLRSIGWSRKTARRVAKEQNKDLRNFNLHNLSSFRSYHLVYVDESGCGKRIGFRRTGWSPLGVSPVQIARFHRGQRYQILPAYSQNGILLARMFRALPTVISSRTLLNSSFHIVADG